MFCDRKVTVLMTTHNGERFIGESIRSVFAQTYGDFNFFIVDDCSTDGTFDAIAEYVSDLRVQLFTYLENVGQTEALNYGLSLVDTEYVARIDQDDYWEPDKLERQVRFMEKFGSYAVLGTWYGAVDGDGNHTHDFCPPFLHDRIVRCFPVYNPFAHSSLLMRTDAVKEMGGYPKNYRYGQDFPLLIRIAGKYGVHILPVLLTGIRFHEGQSMKSNVRGKSLEMARSIRLALKTFDYDIKLRTKGYMAMLFYMMQACINRDVAHIVKKRIGGPWRT